MKKRNEDNPENLGEFLRPDGSKQPEVERGDLLPAEVLKKLNELLELIHRTGQTNQGSTVINIYEKGSMHIDHVDNQNFYGDASHKPKKVSKAEDPSVPKTFNQDTPLSALFRENHHEELRKVIESWRPYLIGDDPKADALAMTHFEFDKKEIYSNHAYYDLLDLDDLGALQVPLSQLASYLADHSNLSCSDTALYQQLKYYRQICRK